MSRVAWLNERHKGLGATDAASIAGVGWRTPEDIYHEKVQTEFVNDSDYSMRMELGLALEDYIASQYFRARPDSGIDDTPQIVRDPREPWRSCSPDRVSLAGQSRKLLEFKTVFSAPNEEWGDPGTDHIPDRFIIQVQHALDVCLAAGVVTEAVADVAVLFVPHEFRIYSVRLNPDLLEPLTALEREFWDRVLNKAGIDDWNPPLREELHKRLAALLPGTTVELGAGAADIIRELDKLAPVKEAGDEARRRIDVLKSQLGVMLGDSEIGILPDGRRVKRYVSPARSVFPRPYVRQAHETVRILSARRQDRRPIATGPILPSFEDIEAAYRDAGVPLPDVFDVHVFDVQQEDCTSCST